VGKFFYAEYATYEPFPARQTDPPLHARENNKGYFSLAGKQAGASYDAWQSAVDFFD